MPGIGSAGASGQYDPPAARAHDQHFGDSTATGQGQAEIIEQGQAEGVFRTELDARFASWVVYGGLEEILTGWVMGRLPDGEEEVARAERTILDVVCGGLAPRPVAV